MIACVLIQDGTFGYFLVQNTAKQLPKSKKTVVFGIHRLTTDAGTPLYLRYCIPPKRKEASDARCRRLCSCLNLRNDNDKNGKTLEKYDRKRHTEDQG